MRLMLFFFLVSVAAHAQPKSKAKAEPVEGRPPFLVAVRGGFLLSNPDGAVKRRSFGSTVSSSPCGSAGANTSVAGSASAAAATCSVGSSELSGPWGFDIPRKLSYPR